MLTSYFKAELAGPAVLRWNDILVIYQRLGPADQGKSTENLGLDLKGDIEILRH